MYPMHLGTINPVTTIIEEANKVGAAVLIDGAQSAAHMHVDVQKLGAAFYVTSAHKLVWSNRCGYALWTNRVVRELPRPLWVEVK